MDGRQSEEFLLTSAQTVMGIALLLGLRLGFRGALALFGLFAVTFVITDPNVRLWMSVVYLAIAAVVLIVQRKHIAETLKAPSPSRANRFSAAAAPARRIRRPTGF